MVVQLEPEIPVLFSLVLGALIIVLLFFISASSFLSFIHRVLALLGWTSATEPKFQAIEDNYHSFNEVCEAMKNVGLHTANLILAIDYSKSNLFTGRHCYRGTCLHGITNTANPYQRVITCMQKALEPFGEDPLIPCFGFGDVRTQDEKVFPFYDNKVCHGWSEVLDRYAEITPHIVLGGPTSFAPVIYETIRIVKELKKYHILVIVTDGQIVDEQETEEAVVEASNYPLSIICIGVGDGPWDTMMEFDDGLPKRKFDNFQFVDFNGVMKDSNNSESAFALQVLMEVPEQFTAIQNLGLLKKD